LKPTLADSETLATDAAGVARMLDVSVRTVWSMEARGALPPPAVRSGRVIRWSVEDIKKWLLLGGPSAEKFENLKRSVCLN